MEKIDTLCEKLSLNEFEKVTPLKNLADKLKVKVSYLVLGLIVVLLLMIVLEFGSSLLTSIIGFLYPAFMSFKAIESKDTDDDRQWLTYWVVFSFFTVFDPLLNTVLFFIPMYYLFKVLIYVWLFHPYTKGAEKVYTSFLRSLFLKNERYIDSKVKDIQNKAGEVVGQAGDAVKRTYNDNKDSINKVGVDLLGKVVAGTAQK